MADDVHVAMLRGINVGGKNRLRMADLAATFREGGCDDVRTHIQSGNVVFRAPDMIAARIADVVRDALLDRFELRVPVVTRSADEMLRVAPRNPYIATGADSDALHVAFLADEPDDAGVAMLDPNRSLPDDMQVIGRDIYLRYPGGLARTKLTNDYFDRALGTVSTVRNWRTVLRLVEMVNS